MSLESTYLDLLAQANQSYGDYGNQIKSRYESDKTSAEKLKEEAIRRLAQQRERQQQENYIAQRQTERAMPNYYASRGYTGGPVASLDLQNRLAYENNRLSTAQKYNDSISDTTASFDEQLSSLAKSYEDYMYDLQKQQLETQLNYKTLAAQAAEQARLQALEEEALRTKSQSSDYYSDGGMPEVEDGMPEVEDGISNTLPGWATGYVEPNVGFAAKTPEEYASEIMAASKNKKSSIPLSGQWGVGGYSVAPGYMTNAVQEVKTPTVTTTVVGNPAKTSGSYYAQKYDKTGRYK